MIIGNWKNKINVDKVFNCASDQQVRQKAVKKTPWFRERMNSQSTSNTFRAVVGGFPGWGELITG